jgi:hypothetical protein
MSALSAFGAWNNASNLGVLFYGVVSAQTEKVVEFFLEREAGEGIIGEVRGDEPVLAEELRVEGIELG